MSTVTGRASRSISVIAGLVFATALSVLAASPAPAPSIAQLSAADVEGKAMLPVKNEGTMIKVLSAQPASYVAVSKFTSADGYLDASVKRYEKVTLGLSDWPIDEFIYLLRGQVEITDAAGTAKVYSQGDAFVLPKGFSGTWRQLSAVDMIAVVHGSGS